MLESSPPIKFLVTYTTTQKMKFFINGFFSKCDEIRSLMEISSYLLKKSLIENFIFCAVYISTLDFTKWKSYLTVLYMQILTIVPYLSYICSATLSQKIEIIQEGAWRLFCN